MVWKSSPEEIKMDSHFTMSTKINPSEIKMEYKNFLKLCNKIIEPGKYKGGKMSESTLTI